MPLESLDSLSLQRRLDDIGRTKTEVTPREGLARGAVQQWPTSTVSSSAPRTGIDLASLAAEPSFAAHLGSSCGTRKAYPEPVEEAA